MANKSDRKVLIKDFQYLLCLLDPSFIEHDGLVFFAPHFNKTNYEKYWRLSAREDKYKTERTINHVHLTDILAKPEDQYKLGKVIIHVWERALTTFFPGQKFNLVLSKDTPHDWIIDMSH